METMLNPKVTIIIPVYNGSNFVKQAIESAINQTYKNVEILVVNDGSTDDGKTEKAVLEFGDKVRYIKKENGGVASALNLGIKEAAGDYISWLSHDDLYKPNKLEEQVKVLNSLEDKTTILFSNVELIDEHGDIIAITNYANQIGVKTLCQGTYPVIKGTVNGCATLIAKKCFEKVGPFDEKLRTTNDYDMWMRLFKEFKSLLIEKPLIQYRIHKNQDTNKSPYIVKEANELWTGIINELDEEQIKEWGFEPFNIYMDLYFQMYYSKYNATYPVAYEKAKMVYYKGKPRVSIIMPCCNSEKYLDKAIKSVIDQTYRNYELIIIDDNSTDNTEKIINKWLEKDFRIRFYKKNPEDKGIATSMNKGIELAQGEYITRMDSDDIIIPEKIESQVKFLDNNKEYGVCSTNIAMLDKLGNVYNLNVYPEQTVPSEWTFLWTNPIPNAPCMYRTSLIKENNIKFSNLKTAEDYDFLRKLITKTKVYMINEPLYYYRKIQESAYNSNIEETFKTSLDICTKYYQYVIAEESPSYYKFLTWFYTEDDEPEMVDVKEINDFLQKTAKKLKEYYKWDEEQYNNVKIDILKIIEKYAVFKYLVPKYGRISANFEIKEENKSSLSRLIKRGRRYLRKNGTKKTIRKVIQKVKGKIWRRK